jgi:hypothetical protein
MNMTTGTSSLLKERLPELTALGVHESPWQLPNNHIVLGLEGALCAVENYFVGDETPLVEFLEFLIEDAKRRKVYYPMHIETRFVSEGIPVPVEDEERLVRSFLEAARKCNLLEALAVLSSIKEEKVVRNLLARLSSQTEIIQNGHGKELVFSYLRLSHLLNGEDRWRFLTQVVQTLFKGIFGEMCAIKAAWGRVKFLGETLKAPEANIIPREEMAEDDERRLLDLVRAGEGRKAMWYIDEMFDPEDDELKLVCVQRAIESVGTYRHSLLSCRTAINFEPHLNFIDNLFMWRGVLEYFLIDSEPTVTLEEFDGIIREGQKEQPEDLTVDEILELTDAEQLIGSSVRYLEQGKNIKVLYTGLLLRALAKDKSVHLLNTFNALYAFGEQFEGKFRRYALARAAWEAAHTRR